MRLWTNGWHGRLTSSTCARLGQHDELTVRFRTVIAFNMRTLSPSRAAGLCTLGLAMFALNCATPTALAVSVHSELSCEVGSAVVIVGSGDLLALPEKVPSSTSTSCDSQGAHGSVVIVPTASKNENVAFAVMQRSDGQPADSCLDPKQMSGCIVAKRQFRFSQHHESEMRIDLRVSCLGIVCETSQTCVRGICLNAQIDCGGACDETALISQTQTVPNAEPLDSGGANAFEAGRVDAGGDTAAASPLTCPVGGCTQTCSTGPTCRASCEGGNCTQICSAGVSCDFTCAAGGCTNICGDGSSCTMGCTSGKCTQVCGSNATCTTKCPGAECTNTCGPGSTCKSTS